MRWKNRIQNANKDYYCYYQWIKSNDKNKSDFKLARSLMKSLKAAHFFFFFSLPQNDFHKAILVAYICYNIAS